MQGVQTPELDARLLVCAACGLSHETFIAEPGRALNDREMALIAQYRERRAGHEPVSRILGEREFWGLSFALSPDTLDPRPDSETLLAALLELIREGGDAGRSLSLLDAGTGSGCILVSALRELPGAHGTGCDISPDALASARANAERHGVGARAAFIRGEWLDAMKGRFDYVVSNPPYIPSDEIDGLSPEVARFDPRRALDGGGDGLDCYRRIAARLADVLAAGGWAVFEVGDAQHEAVLELLRSAGLGRGPGGTRLYRDLSDKVRCVAVRARFERTMTGQKGVGNRR